MEIITADLLRYHLYFCIYIGGFATTLILLGMIVNVYEWLKNKINNLN